MSQVEHPKYTVLQKYHHIEIREYPALLVAQVSETGDRRESISNGFRALANYIFGNNTTSKKIAMTAPVTQQASEKIAMTAPVTQTKVGDKWEIRFIMPSSYTMETIPKPNNEKVKLIEMPPRKFVVIRFSGRGTKENLKQHLQKLTKFIKEKDLNVTGEPIYAFYNPPWTLPFLRRNEIMWELLR